jgi:hypothetical protein
MAVLAVAMMPDSPDGTNAMVIGLSAAPSWPAAGAVGASVSWVQTGGMAVGAMVGTPVKLAGTTVGGTAVDGTVVAAVPHAVNSIVAATSSETNKNAFFITSSPLMRLGFRGNLIPHGQVDDSAGLNILQVTCVKISGESSYFIFQIHFEDF